MSRVVFALAAHPDDIEFMMAGTLLLLKDKGCELHYMNVANGSCGTATHSYRDIVRIRTEESRSVANQLGARFHEPLVDDLEIFYEIGLLRRVAAVVRDVQPDMLLLQSPQDYMEDHMNTSRLGITAAFSRGMINFETDPPRPAYDKPLGIYHAQPHSMQGQLRERIDPHFYVDITSTHGQKRKLLACHESQKAWLDESQGFDSYLDAMTEMSAEMGRRAGQFEYAEGWRRHSSIGFAVPEYDPLVDLIGRENIVEIRED